MDVCGEEEEEECFPMEEACTNTFDTTCASSIHDPRKRKKETEMSEVQGEFSFGATAICAVTLFFCAY